MIYQKRRYPFTALIACWLAIVPCYAAENLTLDAFFAAAMQRSDAVAEQVELIEQAQERYEQATATLRPTVNGIASYTWQDSGARDSSANPTRQPHARISATQPLFRGFREFAAMRQTKALIEAQSEEHQNARLQLFKDVAQNFFDVLALEQDLKNLDAQIDQQQRREKEIQDRIRIGRSRVGEVLTVQSSVSALRAEVEQLRGQLAASREVFAFLSGLPATTPLHDTEPMPVVVDPVEDYLARVQHRPDIRAGNQRLAAARENIDAVKGERMPTLDLNANHYLERRGSLSEVDWDVQLALTVPLYTGGSLQSRVREAASQRDQAELSTRHLGRQAEQEIRALYHTVTFDRSRLTALETATAAAKKNYEAQQRDYRLGLVTNLDVLQAYADFQENQRALDRARYAAKLNFLKLEAAAVRRPALISNSGGVN